MVTMWTRPTIYLRSRLHPSISFACDLGVVASRSDRNSYLVMMFNFSLVSPDLENIRESFEDNGQLAIQGFVDSYQRFFSPVECEDILNASTVEKQLRRVFFYAGKKNLKTYLLIDEYDNFTNTILADEGQHAYEEITQGSGFFRYFFNLLKGATGGQISGLNRLFITGVSPVKKRCWPTIMKWVGCNYRLMKCYKS